MICWGAFFPVFASANNSATYKTYHKTKKGNTKHKMQTAYRTFAKLLMLAGLSIYVSPAFSDTDEQIGPRSEDRTWEHCQTRFLPDDLIKPNQASQRQVRTNELYINSDKAQADNKDNFRFEGNVQMQRNELILNADSADYEHDREKVTAQGTVRFQTEKQLLLGDNGVFQLEDNKAIINNAQFWIVGSHMRGEAESVNILSADAMELHGVKFTSCDTQQEDWSLRASELEIDQLNNEGIAYHARIEFMHVPFFYFPYLSFPLSGRKTGFLVPNLGESDLSGKEITVPYYFNIAPNRDATITPRHFSKRGMQYGGEYRYLHKNSAGQLDLVYLPDDKLFQDDRFRGEYQHAGTPATGWRTDARYQYVSDNDYLNDFSNNLKTSSISHLERHLDVVNQNQYGQLTTRLQTYQTIDETITPRNEPYQRLPQLLFSSINVPLAGGLETAMNAELVRFDRDEGVVGQRLNLIPELSWPYRQAAGFFTPTLKMRHTRYNLARQDPNSLDRPTRSVPVFSVDSGLFFERDVNTGSRELLQTLEPRIYYLYVPFRDQENLIVDDLGNEVTFDSSLPQFSFATLFRDNRFSGGDRVGDADQLSATLTSRFLSDTGAEIFAASVGQVFYFRDREVTLPGSSVETVSESDTVAELRTEWSKNLDSRASLVWDNQENQSARGSLQFRYQFGRDKITHLSYRYERDEIDQADVSFLWALKPQWKIVGRWNYSFLDNLKLETLAGFEYSSCCWAIRVVQRDYIDDLEDETRNQSIWLQLELKGLANVGRKVDSAFETGSFSD